MIFRQTNLDGAKLWNGGVGLGRERGDRKDGGKVHTMAIGSEEEDTLVHGEGRATEKKVEREGGKEGIGIREEIRRGKRRGRARDWRK